MMSTVPIYMDASLQRTLIKDMESYQLSKGAYPGIYSVEKTLLESTPLAEQIKLSEELPERDWKAQTVTTMLTRLEKKGFLRSKKTGKERDFFPAISEQEYFSLEAEGFRKMIFLMKNLKSSSSEKISLPF